MNEISRLRLTVVGVVVIALFGALLGRLWYLQVLDAPTFVRAAVQNQIRVVCEPAPRGRILDRNGVVLVDNLASEAITLDRVSARQHPEVIDRLAALLNTTADAINKSIGDPRYSAFKPVPVATDAEFDKVAFVKEHSQDFPGVDAVALAQRTYPMGTLAAHLIGYVGAINDAELKAHAPKNPNTDQAVPTPTCADYEAGDLIGKTGVEQAYDEALRGHPGVTRLEVDRQGRVLRVLSHTDAIPGDDLFLTIDANIQKTAEESLAQGLADAQGHKDVSGHFFAAPAGAAVVTDPRDGSVLALASFPTYNPADFVGGISQDKFDAYNNDPNHPLIDRAISAQYAPGSTFKLITATAAMRTGLITAQTTVADGGSYTIAHCTGAGCVKHNAGGEGLGRVDLPSAITKSSDVYFYRIGDLFWQGQRQYGQTPIQDQARAFGLADKTGVGLVGEAGGRVSTPELRRQDFDHHPGQFAERNWFAGDNANLAIGQGETLVTPIQLANAYATFANGGTLYSPHVSLKEVTPGDDPQTTVTSPTIKGKVDLPPEIQGPILQGLSGVTGGNGTAYAAFRDFPQSTFPLAAKTGTAQVTGKQDTSVFVAFGPTPTSQYCVAVILEQSGFGASAAAPVAKRIFEPLAGLQPTDVHVETGGTSA